MINVTYPAISSYTEAVIIAAKLGAKEYEIEILNPKYLENNLEQGYVIRVGNKIYFNDPSLWMTVDFAQRSNVFLWMN